VRIMFSGKNGLRTALVIIVVRTAHLVSVLRHVRDSKYLTWSLCIVAVVLACEK
jgi:hypothetical protein